jgi:D-glycero-D-manno-heptose 1,7-bisphosphate phosphatase
VTRRAAFVDRDGTINHLVPDPRSGLPESPLRVADVSLIPGAAPALRALAQDGWLLIGVSNQPAAAKGLLRVEELLAVHEQVIKLLNRAGVRFDDFQLCLHHPDGVVPALTGDCACRKPNPGMLLEGARQLNVDLGSSWMIGDTDTDVRAGLSAGCRTVLVEHSDSRHKRSGTVRADATAPDLGAAVAWIRGTH